MYFTTDRMLRKINAVMDVVAQSDVDPALRGGYLDELNRSV